ncbi:MAG: TolC family protein [Candidatus Eremiobacteraeota bacterium]|nr:TolC family protein [Candidatus Eremiobacteraeota bacterium]
MPACGMRRMAVTGVVTTGLCFLSAATAAAQPLTLQQTVAYAMTHNTTIASKEAAVAQAESNWTRQRATEYPPVVATLQNQMEKQNNYAGPYAQYGVAPIPNFSQNTAQVGTQWTLYNGSLNQILTQQYRRQVESARADLRETQTRTTAKLVDMFFAIAKVQHLYQLAQANLIYQQALLVVAQAKERAGIVAGVDVLRAEVGVEQTQVALLNTQSDQESARESLAQTIGASLDTAFAVPSVLPEPPIPPGSSSMLVKIAQDNRPEIAAAVAGVAIAQLSRSSIDTDLLPQINVFASFGNQTSPTGFVDQQNQFNFLNQQCASNPNQVSCVGFPFANVARGTPGFWDIGATSTLSLPIIDYGTRAAAHRSANKAVDSAQLALDSAKTMTEEDVLESLRQANTTREALGYQRKAVDLGAEAAHIAQLQYSNGLISLTDTKAAQATSLQTQADLFSAEIAYINAVVKLRSALGTFDPAATVADL